MWRIENYLKYIIGMVLLWLIVWSQSSFGCAPMPTDQMMPRMKKEDYFLYYPRERAAGNFSRNRDLVFFNQRSETWGIKTDEFVARVIGLPGDRVRIDNGVVNVNGDPIPDDYVQDVYKSRDDLPEIIVPRDHLFVLSDMRANFQLDSRTFGPISRHSIKGRVKPD